MNLNVTRYTYIFDYVLPGQAQAYIQVSRFNQSQVAPIVPSMVGSTIQTGHFFYLIQPVGLLTILTGIFRQETPSGVTVLSSSHFSKFLCRATFNSESAFIVK